MRPAWVVLFQSAKGIKSDIHFPSDGTACPARTGDLYDLTVEAVCAAFCRANETELLKSFTALADYHEAKNYLEVPF